MTNINELQRQVAWAQQAGVVDRQSGAFISEFLQEVKKGEADPSKTFIDMQIAKLRENPQANAGAISQLNQIGSLVKSLDDGKITRREIQDLIKEMGLRENHPTAQAILGAASGAMKGKDGLTLPEFLTSLRDAGLVSTEDAQGVLDIVKGFQNPLKLISSMVVGQGYRSTDQIAVQKPQVTFDELEAGLRAAVQYRAIDSKQAVSIAQMIDDLKESGDPAARFRQYIQQNAASSPNAGMALELLKHLDDDVITLSEFEQTLTDGGLVKGSPEWTDSIKTIRALMDGANELSLYGLMVRMRDANMISSTQARDIMRLVEAAKDPLSFLASRIIGVDTVPRYL